MSASGDSLTRSRTREHVWILARPINASYKVLYCPTSRGSIQHVTGAKYQQQSFSRSVPTPPNSRGQLHMLIPGWGTRRLILDTCTIRPMLKYMNKTPFDAPSTTPLLHMVTGTHRQRLSRAASSFQSCLISSSLKVTASARQALVRQNINWFMRTLLQ